MKTTININALRTGLSAGALDCLDGAIALEVFPLGDPLTLYRWALAKSTDARQPVARQAAARELADRIAQTALSQCEWMGA